MTQKQTLALDHMSLSPEDAYIAGFEKCRELVICFIHINKREFGMNYDKFKDLYFDLIALGEENESEFPSQSAATKTSARNTACYTTLC